MTSRSYRTKSRSKSISKRSYKKRLTKKQCQTKLRKKISINMKELKEGRFKNAKQAIAVSYNQVKKKFPSCKRYMKRS